ncbi:hypothetical protein QUF80_00325 [Desulfococcaceae bacterium HSG8]|nr:hypothetical protein [Desulfococcaceae bacterium HSG8]
MIETDKKLAQLKAAYESGILDEETYIAALKGLAGNEPGKTVQGKNLRGVTQADNITNLNQYFLQDENKADPEKMRAAYLHRLLCDAGILSLEGIDPEASTCDTERLNLGAIYTALLTRSAEGREPEIMKSSETRRFSALEIANRHRHAVLLGDPGSGKTTFVNFVALCLAGESLGHLEANLDLLTSPIPPDEEKKDDEAEEKRQPWEHGPLLPVRIILRDFAARNLPDREASASDLWQFIEDELKRTRFG